MTLRICSRSKDIIEPYLKPQWYVSMKEMAAMAYKAVEDGDLIINPKLSETGVSRDNFGGVIKPPFTTSRSKARLKAYYPFVFILIKA
jgi:tRNA synthetases class I (I, L, M and V)